MPTLTNSTSEFCSAICSSLGWRARPANAPHELSTSRLLEQQQPRKQVKGLQPTCHAPGRKEQTDHQLHLLLGCSQVPLIVGKLGHSHTVAGVLGFPPAPALGLQLPSHVDYIVPFCLPARQVLLTELPIGIPQWTGEQSQKDKAPLLSLLPTSQSIWVQANAGPSSRSGGDRRESLRIRASQDRAGRSCCGHAGAC